MYRLFSHLSLWKKFAILSGIITMLFIIPTILYTLLGYDIIQKKYREIDGLGPSVQNIHVMKLLQQHRGMTAMLLNGNKNIIDARKDKAAEINTAFEALLQHLQSSVVRDQTIIHDKTNLFQEWKALVQLVDGGHITASQSFLKHNDLINHLFRLQSAILNDFNMITDSDLDSNQLIQGALVYLPLLTDELGKIRAQGASILTSKTLTTQNRLTITMLEQRIHEQYANMDAAFQTAFRANAYLTNNTDIDESLDDATQAMKQALILVNQVILDENASLSYSADDYFKIWTAVIDKQLKVSDVAVNVLHENLSYQGKALIKQIGFVLLSIVVLGVLSICVVVGISHSITKPISEAVQMAKSVAAFDLTQHSAVKGKDEPSQLLMALNSMNESLVKIIRDIYSNIDRINAESAEIAKGNLDLSTRTENQATSLEETASSMDEITSVLKQNTERVSEADQQANASAEMADNGGQSVTGIIETMRSINDSSQKIVDIITVIDGIAFQTNILALNAAVEAARAGEQGQGFAVVATEVRNLAQRSGAAAKEIKNLVNTSVDKIQDGNTLVEDAGGKINQIIPIAKALAQIMSEINLANQEQTTGIVQVNQAINQIEAITQQNAALVEQVAAASQNMQEQARQLLASISLFRINPDS